MSRPQRRGPFRGATPKKRRSEQPKARAHDQNSSVWVLVLSETASAHTPATATHKKISIPVEQHLEDQLRAIVREIRASAQSKNQSDTGRRGNRRAKLTDRQLQIASMVKDGHSNKVIARALGLSVGTVKVHLHRIFTTLDVASRVQLANVVRDEMR
jgi:DNA-binding NarL/FixJ family response regulator